MKVSSKRLPALSHINAPHISYALPVAHQDQPFFNKPHANESNKVTSSYTNNNIEGRSSYKYNNNNNSIRISSYNNSMVFNTRKEKNEALNRIKNIKSGGILVSKSSYSVSKQNQGESERRRDAIERPKAAGLNQTKKSDGSRRYGGEEEENGEEENYGENGEEFAEEEREDADEAGEEGYGEEVGEEELERSASLV